MDSQKLNIFLFILYSLILVQYTSAEGDQGINKKFPYITALFTERGKKSTVSITSIIHPIKAFMTKTKKEMIIDQKDEYQININNGINENNITLEFKRNDANLRYLFYNINHIKKIDLSYYNIKVNDTSYMFSDCKNLVEIIFGNFDTSQVKNMAGMFKNTKVTSLDLSNFKTSQVTDMYSMFYSCTKLVYLNLKKFDFSNVIDANDMFNEVENSLLYLNIHSIDDDGYVHFNKDLLEKINNNSFVICINKAKASLLYEYIRKKNFTLDCSYFDEKETYIANTDYFYEDTNIPSNSITAQVEVTKKIKKEETCSPEDFFKGKCGIENENTDKVISVEQKDNMINNIIDDIMNKNLNNILDNILEGKKDVYIIQQDDISYQLTTTENQINNKYNNISTINLGECETILKNIYKIDNSSSLII